MCIFGLCGQDSVQGLFVFLLVNFTEAHPDAIFAYASGLQVIRYTYPAPTFHPEFSTGKSARKPLLVQKSFLDKICHEFANLVAIQAQAVQLLAYLPVRPLLVGAVAENSGLDLFL